MPDMSAAPLFLLSGGMWSFKTVATAVELGLFDHLDARPATTEEVCAQLGLTPQGGEMMLAVCASVGLLEKSGQTWHTSPLASTYMVSGKPLYFGAFISYVDRYQYLPWHGIAGALRTGRPLTWDPDKHDTRFYNAEVQKDFYNALHAASASTAEEFAHVIAFPYRRLLDVGGGSGLYSAALCRTHPNLVATVFDLPSVVPLCRGYVAGVGLDDRVKTVAGDFCTDTLPASHDVLLLSHILHDWDDATCHKLLDSCYTALDAGGTIVVNEMYLNAERTGPLGAALLGINMIGEFGDSRNFSHLEIEDWLVQHGFTDVRYELHDLPTSTGVVIGIKP